MSKSAKRKRIDKYNLLVKRQPLVFVIAVSLLVVSACKRDDALLESSVEKDKSTVESGPKPQLVPDLSNVEKRKLISLGYQTSMPIDKYNLKKDGVVFYDSEKAVRGVNVYCSENSGTLMFIDMKGELIHSVSVQIENRERTPELRGNLCKLASFDKNGDFVMVVEGTKLVKASLYGKTYWNLLGPYHHDVDIAPDGMVWAIANEQGIHSEIDDKQMILDNLFVAISPEGKVVQRVSLAGMVAKVPALLEKTKSYIAAELAKLRSRIRKKMAKRPTLMRRLLNNIDERPVDAFHSNTVEVIRKDITLENGLVFKKGQILFSSNHLDSIGVFDVKEKRINWHWGINKVETVHHPTMQSDGNIILFDNGVHRKYSRVLIVSPATGKIKWQYKGKSENRFYTGSRGGAQLLTNGNVLITESEKGHVFEIDRSGNLVWDFWNPDRRNRNRNRSSIFLMERLLPQNTPWLPLLYKKTRNRL